MASIVKRPNGSREIRVVLPDGTRPVVRLGRCDQKTAAGVLVHVERLAAAVMSDAVAPPETLAWLSKIPLVLHDRLSRAGLCAARAPVDLLAMTVRKACDVYLSRRTDWQPATALAFQQARKHLTAYFGDDRLMGSISVAEAQDFRRALVSKYSEAYVKKLLRLTRQLWRDAVDRKLLAENPWSSVRLGSDRNPARQYYVDRPTIEKVIAAAPDAQWKLLIALARYAGLRMPSEPLALRWADVDLARGRITVRSAKTRRYAGRETRVVPVFPELRPYLQAALDGRGAGGGAGADGGWVITRYRLANANLRTQLLRVMTRAGVGRWPRLFQNLRDSCETDWVERFPAHVVCAWIGHSEVVARNHYLQVTEAHYAAAAASPTQAPTPAERAGAA